MEENNVFINDDSLYNKKIKSVPRPEPEIGIDQGDSFIQNILASAGEGISSSIDISKIDAFSTMSEGRDQVYTLMDTMARDSKVAAVLETYAADSTEYNDEGKIVWVESSDGNISSYINYLLDTLQVDKHIYGWVYSLLKYGDLYLRLYRESEYRDSLLFDEPEEEENKRDKLNEDIYVKAYKKNDNFIHYLEAIPNPAEVFELTKFGKTQAFIKTHMSIAQSRDQNPALYTGAYRYSFRKSDVDIYQPNMFVHACLEDGSTRSPEIVEIFRDPKKDANGNEQTTAKTEYTVRKGKSLLYDHFKIWRLLTLLENSMLLNRLTKSSILRVIGVQVGDMPKEAVGKHLNNIKSLMEQKSAINTGDSLSEYTNPGPMENNVYVPIRGEQGAITTSQIGGDVNVKDIADIEYFTNMFYGGLRVPKAYFGFTDDGAGFNGGTSLSIISARYANEVKRIQNTIIQALTTAINIMLIDKGMDSYVNEFTLRMLPPTTQDELDRRENTSSKMQIAQDISNLTADVDDPVIKLKITKALLSTITSDEEIIQLLEEQIKKLEAEGAESEPEQEDKFGGDDEGDLMGTHEPLDLNRSALGGDFGEQEEETEIETPEEEPAEETVLPTPADLGIDMTQNEEGE